jgi:dihydroorotate dehydrogenase
MVLTPIGSFDSLTRDDEPGLFNLGFGWVEVGSVTPKPQVRMVCSCSTLRAFTTHT